MAPKFTNKSKFDFLVFLLASAPFLSGCEPTTQPKGSNGAIQADQDTSQSKGDGTDEEVEGPDSAVAKDKGTKKKTPITKAIDTPGDPQTAGSPSTPVEATGLGKSGLNWNGTSLIGTPQLFLIPIE